MHKLVGTQQTWLYRAGATVYTVVTCGVLRSNVACLLLSRGVLRFAKLRSGMIRTRNPFRREQAAVGVGTVLNDLVKVTVHEVAPL